MSIHNFHLAIINNTLQQCHFVLRLAFLQFAWPHHTDRPVVGVLVRILRQKPEKVSVSLQWAINQFDFWAASYRTNKTKSASTNLSGFGTINLDRWLSMRLVYLSCLECYWSFGFSDLLTSCQGGQTCSPTGKSKLWVDRIDNKLSASIP